jgi:sugar transferase (PEP-CTERM/EpsH1 system associated)
MTPAGGEVLFLAHRVPYPPDRGDKIRSYHALAHIAARARVHLVTFADADADHDPPEALRALLASCTIVPRTKSQPRAAAEALLCGRPVSLAAFACPRIAAATNDILSTRRIGAIHCFSGQMAQYLPDDVGRVVMDFGDVDSAKFEAFADRARGPMRWMMRRESRLLAVFERAVSARVSASLFVSDAEAALFRDRGGQGRIVAVENGIDAAVFDPALPHERPTGAGPRIVFTGQMDYAPNVEAATWFADAILPLIRQSCRDAQFVIVGRAPVAAVTGLGKRSGITVTGAVPDVRGWLAVADVCVAPLLLARGVQNKVLEAMAMARPVVASAAAAEGIDHAGTIAVAADAAAFADRVVAMLEDRPGAAAMGARARARVIGRYGWQARLAPLDALLELGPAA